jgi:hypothetical protein
MYYQEVKEIKAFDKSNYDATRDNRLGTPDPNKLQKTIGSLFQDE